MTEQKTAAGIKSDRNCYNCLHRGTVPGSCHKSCRNTKAHVLGDPHGIKNGWFFWPSDFDPVWVLSCDGWEGKPTE